jgi:hypothetical protein
MPDTLASCGNTSRSYKNQQDGVTHGPHASMDGAITRAVKAPRRHPPPCPVVMVSLHERQGLVRWALMEAQARLLGFSTISVMAITPALMATRAINASALLVFSPCGKFYIGHLGPKHNIIPLVLLQDLACSAEFQSAWCSAQPCHEKEASPDEGQPTIAGLADTTTQGLPLELSCQAGTIRVLLGRIGLHRLLQSLALPVQRVSMAHTTARTCLSSSHTRRGPSGFLWEKLVCTGSTRASSSQYRESPWWMPGGRRNSTQLGGISSFPTINRPGGPACHLHHHSLSGVSCDGLHCGRRSLTSGGPLGTKFSRHHGRRPCHGLCCCK